MAKSIKCQILNMYLSEHQIEVFKFESYSFLVCKKVINRQTIQCD